MPPKKTTTPAKKKTAAKKSTTTTKKKVASKKTSKAKTVSQNELKDTTEKFAQEGKSFFQKLHSRKAIVRNTKSEIYIQIPLLIAIIVALFAPWVFLIGIMIVFVSSYTLEITQS